jgi:hypothetical protein
MEAVASSSSSARRLLRTPAIEHVNMRGDHRYSGQRRVKGRLHKDVRIATAAPQQHGGKL